MYVAAAAAGGDRGGGGGGHVDGGGDLVQVLVSDLFSFDLHSLNSFF